MIYFVRHGESEANVRKVFAGQRDDSVLTDKGRAQARETARALREEGIQVDRIVASSLQRAFETARIIAEEIEHERDIDVDDRIMEYDMGEMTGTPHHAATSLEMVSSPGAEDTQSFHDRVRTCVEELAQSPENILIVSHAGVGRMLETIRDGRDVKLFYDLAPWPNASVTKIDWI